MLSRLQVLRGLTTGKTAVAPAPELVPEAPEVFPELGELPELVTVSRPEVAGRQPLGGGGSVEAPVEASVEPPVAAPEEGSWRSLSRARDAEETKLTPADPGPGSAVAAGSASPVRPKLAVNPGEPSLPPPRPRRLPSVPGGPGPSFIPGTGIPILDRETLTEVTGFPSPSAPPSSNAPQGASWDPWAGSWTGWLLFMRALPDRVRQLDRHQVMALARQIVERARSGDRRARGILGGLLLVIAGTVIAATGGGEAAPETRSPTPGIFTGNGSKRGKSPRVLFQAAASPDQPANYGNFLRRNPFDLTSDDAPSPAPGPVEPVPTAPPPDPGPDVDQVLKSVSLVGTYVSAARQYAILQVKDSPRAQMLEIGDRLELPGPPVESIEVAAIAPREIQVAVRGATRALKMQVEDWKSNAPPAAAPEASAAPAAAAAPNLVAGGDAATAVRKIPRAELDHYLENLHTVLTQVNLQPAYQNGRQVGFRIGNIERGSLLARLGVDNGDVVRFINGQRIDSVQSAYQVYNILRDSTNVEMTVLRNTRPVVLRYLVY